MHRDAAGRDRSPARISPDPGPSTRRLRRARRPRPSAVGPPDPGRGADLETAPDDVPSLARIVDEIRRSPIQLRALALSRFVRQRLRMLASTPRQDDLQALRELMEAGKVTPVIDRTYPLAEAPEAMRHLVEGHGGAGKVVITVEDEPS